VSIGGISEIGGWVRRWGWEYGCVPPQYKNKHSRNKPRMEQCKTEEHLRARGTREALADGEEFLVLHFTTISQAPLRNHSPLNRPSY
jgi:hypothetical protein